MLPAARPARRQIRRPTTYDLFWNPTGIRIPASPPQAPRANAICETTTGTPRRELPGQLLIVNERHLHRAPDPPKTNPRQTHTRVRDRRVTAPACCEKKQVTVTIVYSSPQGRLLVVLRGLALSRGRAGHRDPGASGSPNRRFRPDPVRHMSVTTAVQRHTMGHHDAQRDYSKTARSAGKPQATGYIHR